MESNSVLKNPCEESGENGNQPTTPDSSEGCNRMARKSSTNKFEEKKLQINFICERTIKNQKGLFRVVFVWTVEKTIERAIASSNGPFQRNLLPLCAERFRVNSYTKIRIKIRSDICIKGQIWRYEDCGYGSLFNS